MTVLLFAEDVETEAQQTFLVAEGCETARGCLYSKPLPADKFATRLVARCSGAVATSGAG